jgi:PAS domain S-box-containing protein
MHWQFNPYAIPLFLSAFPLAGIAAMAWQRRHASLSIRQFFWFVVSALGLVLSYAMELFSADLPTMMVWLRVEYFFHIGAVFWLLFALAYAGHETRITRRLVISLFAIPAIILPLVWTNDLHGLIWRYTGTRIINGLALFDREYGPLFWVWLVYTYTLSLSGILILVIAIRRSPERFRGQITLLILVMGISLAANVMSIARLTPIPLLDTFPYGVALMCIPLSLAVFRLRLLDLMPAALDLVFQSMADGVIVLDDQRRVISLNPAAERWLKTRAALVIGNRFEDVDARFSRLFSPHLDVGEVSAEILIETDKGNQYFDVHVSPLRNRRGSVTGQVLIIRSITRRKQAEAEAQQYAAELEARNQELDLFSRTVAHDLKSPLTIIHGYAGMVMADEGLSPESRDFLGIVQGAASRLSALIDDLLTLANVRDLSATVAAVPLRPVVEAAIARFQGIIAERRVHVEIEGELPPVMGHASWLEEVFANLVENAIRYIGAENPDPRIRISARRQDSLVRVEVQDNGIGIAPDHQNHLFEAFYRVDRFDKAGTGLGLAIVQSVATRLGGAVGVESEPGAGSTFWFTLPAPATTEA